MPTREEIEAAAKRYQNTSEVAFRADLHILADAYLREHDPTPITAETVIAEGAVVEVDELDSPFRIGPVWMYIDTAHDVVCFDSQGNEMFPQPRTMGELRQLIARLEG